MEHCICQSEKLEATNKVASELWPHIIPGTAMGLGQDGTHAARRGARVSSYGRGQTPAGIVPERYEQAAISGSADGPLGAP